MPVTFNGSGLIPAPFVSINKTVVRDQRGLYAGQEYNITLNGTIVNVDNSLDSPGASGASDTRMRGTQGGQNYIRNLFNVDFGLLEISSPESTTNKFSIYCKPQSLSFDEGNWVFKNTYTVNLTGNYVQGSDNLNQLESIQESWDIQENEDGSAGISHKVQAQGKLMTIGGSYNSPLNIAKQWVNSRLYNIDSSFSLLEQVNGSGVMYSEMGSLKQTQVLNTGKFSNRARVESTDPISYTYGVTETMMWTYNSYKEEWNASVNMDQDWPHKASISINGNVTGLSSGIYNHSQRLSNASGIYFSSIEPALYTRASLYAPAGYAVNPAYISKQIQYEVIPGNLRYGVTYSALNGSSLVSGAIDETISIQDIGQADVVATIPVPGRTGGPVFQYMYTKTAPKRSVNITAKIGNSGNITYGNLLTSYLSKPNTDLLINALKPGARLLLYRTG